MGNLQNNTKLSVRGGTGNENLAFLDEAIVQYPYHHLMGDSVFIDDIVESITLYKGVLPARYGQALSSMLEVNTVEGKPGFHGKVNLGLLNTYVTVSGASDDQKWNYAGGIRRTHYDLILPLFIQNSDSYTNPVFPYYLDSHGRICYKDSRDTVSFVWLFSEEPMSYTNSSYYKKNVTNSGLMNYADGMVNLDWKHSFNREWYLQQSIGTMWSSQDWQMTEPDNSSLMKTEEQNIRYKTLAGFAPLDWLSFKLGGEIIYYPNNFYTNYVSGFVTNQVTGQPEWMSFDNKYFRGQLGIYSIFFENETDFFENHVYLEDGSALIMPIISKNIHGIPA